MVKTEDEILRLLGDSKSPLTLSEISEKLGKKPKAVFRSLLKLFEEGKINCDPKTRQYALKKE